MNNEKALKFNPVTAMIIAILLVAVLLYIFSKEPFDSGKEKIKELRKRINDDISKLRLAEEKKVELTRKAQKLFRTVIAVSILGFILLNSLLVYIGFDFIQALEGTTLFIGATGAVASIYTFNRISVNALFEMVENKLVLWVYRKNSFDPKDIAKLELQINRSKIELNKIQGLTN